MLSASLNASTGLVNLDKWVSLASQNCGCAKILLSLTDRNGRTPVAVRHVSTIQINYYKSVEHILDRRISAQLL